jgi:hypothetical protein
MTLGKRLLHSCRSRIRISIGERDVAAGMECLLFRVMYGSHGACTMRWLLPGY